MLQRLFPFALVFSTPPKTPLATVAYTQRMTVY